MCLCFGPGTEDGRSTDMYQLSCPKCDVARTYRFRTTVTHEDRVTEKLRAGGQHCDHSINVTLKFISSDEQKRYSHEIWSSCSSQLSVPTDFFHSNILVNRIFFPPFCRNFVFVDKGAFLPVIVYGRIMKFTPVIIQVFLKLLAVFTSLIQIDVELLNIFVSGI